jgi:DNA-binding winged helix-turn-helix (wHTH) protein/TolB-like protein/Tfp pilus assembly protein PilF
MPLKELEVLCVLVENQGRLVTKNEMLDKIWADSFVEEGNLSRHVYLLRKTLKKFGAGENLIENVPRRGYRFTGAAREVSGAEVIIEKYTRTETHIEFHEAEKEATKSRASRSRLTRAVAFAAVFLTVVAILGFSVYRKSAAVEIKSIAVLPFTSIEGENERQGLGLADVLITRLGNLREITVRPTTAVMNLGNENALEAGRKLQADAVLEGSIYRAGDKIRVTARLLRVADGAILWSGQFDKLQKDEISLQNEIALQITDALRLNLSGAERDALAKRYTENRDAFELYQKGRYEWNKRSWGAMTEAQRLFRNAIERDPNFALAYAGLADTLVYSADLLEVENAIQIALELDPNLAEAYAARGFVQTFRRREWQEAEKSFRKSIELNPNYATAHHWYAQVLSVQGRMDEAKREMRKALEINPTSHNFLADLGQIYYFSREYREAEEYCRKALEIYPDFIFAHQYLADIYLQTGRHSEAVEEFIAASRALATFANQSQERQKDLDNDFAGTRNSYAAGGIRKFVEGMTRDAQDDNAAYYQARLLALAGEKEKALERLERAVSSPAFHTVFVKADPIFDSLRDEPRYREILRKMDL